MEAIEEQIVKVNSLIFECSKCLGKNWTSEIDKEIRENIYHLKYLITTEMNDCYEDEIQYILNNVNYITTPKDGNMTYCLINRAFIIPYLEHKKKFKNLN
jgi:hypothetical protein